MVIYSLEISWPWPDVCCMPQLMACKGSSGHTWKNVWNAFCPWPFHVHSLSSDLQKTKHFPGDRDRERERRERELDFSQQTIDLACTVEWGRNSKMPLPHHNYLFFTTVGLVFLLRLAGHPCDLLLRNAFAIKTMAWQGRRCDHIKINVYLTALQWLSARHTKVHWRDDKVRDVHSSLQIHMYSVWKHISGTTSCTWSGEETKITDICNPSARMQSFDNYAFGHVAQ